MASETPQLTRVLVPKFDGVVTGTTGEQISGVEFDRKNTIYTISRTVECSQQSIIYINENNLSVQSSLKVFGNEIF